MELLFPLPDDPDVKYINDRLKLYFDNDEVLVYYGNKIINKYHKNDNEYRKFVIVQLARIGAATFDQLCHGFDMTDKTLEKYLKLSQKNFEEIYNNKTGPKESWKVDFGLRLAIIKIFVNNDSIADREIARQVEQELNISLDHKTVAKVLTEAGLRQKKNDKSGNDKASKNNKNNDNKTIDLFSNENKDIDNVSSSDDEKSECFEKKLEQGIETIYGANLIFPTIENNEKLYQAFHTVYGDIKTDSEFSNKMFLDSLVQQSLLDEYTKDSFDYFEDEDFGVLVHHHRGPNTKEISDFLAEVARQNKAELFAYALSSLTIKPSYQFIDDNGNKIRYRVLLIDGHFDPYYYILATFKGFHTVRRLVMKGDVSYSICDDKGQPIVCTRKTANPKLNKIIPDLLSDYRKMIDNNEILLVGFDREAFDKELFWHIDQLENTYFFTWDKNDKAVSQIPDEKFTESIYEKLTGSNKIDIKYFTTNKKINFDDNNAEKDSEKRMLDLKKFCIHDQNSDKKSSIISDAPDKLIDDSSIITFLLVRQRQENFHKAFKNNKGWDHFTTHLTENKRDRFIVRGVNVPNPKIKLIKKEKTKITNQLNKALNQFAKVSLSKNIPDDMTKKKIHEKCQNILTEIEELKNKKNILFEKEKNLPRHVLIEEAYPDKNIYQRDFEEKSFLEAVKIFAYNKEQTAGWQVAEFCRPKDRFVFLNMLKKRVCKIYSKKNRLFVKIKNFSSPKFKLVAEKFFARLNGRKLKFATDDNYNINFELY